jgi:GntR family transcriptional regulator
VEAIDIDRRADRPAYKQLADHIRGLIAAGVLPAGGALPPESALVAGTGLNRTTVRNALRVLRAEGLVEAVQGRGTYVRRHRLVRQHLLDGLRTEHALVGKMPSTYRDDLWLAITGITAEVDVVCGYRRITAPSEVGEVLGPGREVLCRRYLFYIDDRPHQVSWSYLRWDSVDGTSAADPDSERIHRGTLAQLADLGVTVTSAEITARTRMPTPDEAQLLDLGDGTPVFALRRILYAGAAPVEVSDTAAAGDRLELAVTVDLASERPA